MRCHQAALNLEHNDQRECRGVVNGRSIETHCRWVLDYLAVDGTSGLLLLELLEAECDLIAHASGSDACKDLGDRLREARNHHHAFGGFRKKKLQH